MSPQIRLEVEFANLTEISRPAIHGPMYRSGDTWTPSIHVCIYVCMYACIYVCTTEVIASVEKYRKCLNDA